LAPKARIHFIAWGTAPGFSESEAVSAESATHLVASIESRFQRFHSGQSITWGGAPGLKRMSRL